MNSRLAESTVRAVVQEHLQTQITCVDCSQCILPQFLSMFLSHVSKIRLFLLLRSRSRGESRIFGNGID